MILFEAHSGCRTTRAVHRSCIALDLTNSKLSFALLGMENYVVPVPTIVQTLVSPISTCQRAPDDAPASVEDPRRPEDADPAEVGRRRPFGPGFLITPALDVERFAFFTRPPSFEKSFDEDGDAGSLAVVCPK